MGPNFKKSKINLKPKKPPVAFTLSPHTKRTIVGIVALVIVVGFIYVAGLKLLNALGGTRLVTFFSDVVGKELEVDDNNHTNLLLLGVGGLGHDGEDLTDTIIIASIDHTTDHVSMLSIPRDFYLKTSLGESRINELYAEGKKKWDSPIGLDYTKESIAKAFNIPLHYIVKVDFAALKEVVDSFGGVDINVDQPISDPFYPKDGTYEYEPFYLPAGLQHLDGETALKFARSRKTSSDFDRSHRQQQLLVALKEKAKMQNKLSKASFIKSLYYSLTDHVETTLGIREILSLATFAESWDSTNLTSATVTDDPTRQGGFLYTPDRSRFQGAFVLLPGSELQLQKYVRAMLYADPAITKIPISVLNGTKSIGLAAILKQDLNRYGVQVSRFGNARNQKIPETTWFVNPQWTESQTQAALQKTAQASIITYDESGTVKKVDDEHLKALIDFVTDIVPAPIKKAPDDYINDPRFVDSALILELGPDKQKLIDSLELSYPLIATPTDAATDTPVSDTPVAPLTDTPVTSETK